MKLVGYHLNEAVSENDPRSFADSKSGTSI